MSRIIVLSARRASELRERILRARTIDWLSERECGFLDDLLLKVKKGAGGRISGEQLAWLIDIEDKGQSRSHEL